MWWVEGHRFEVYVEIEKCMFVIYIRGRRPAWSMGICVGGWERVKRGRTIQGCGGWRAIGLKFYVEIEKVQMAVLE